MKFFLLWILCFSISYPEIIRPIDSEDLNYIYVLFEWEQEPDAHEYNIQISNSASFNTIFLDVNVASTVYIEKDVLDWNGSYFWRVRPIFLNGSIGDWIYTQGTSIYSFNTKESRFDNIEITIHNENLIQDGLVAFGAFSPELQSGIIDRDGKEVWNDGGFEFMLNHINNRGNVYGFSTIDYPINTGMKASTDMDVVWSTMDQFNQVDTHEIKQLPNGNYMAFIRENASGPIPSDNYMTEYFRMLGFVADGVTSEFLWYGQKIVEWNQDHEIVWTWSPFDHFTMNDFDNYEGTWYSAYFEQEYDWMHSNAFHFDEVESVIYVSHRHLSRITKIDYPSGQVIWNMGLPSDYMSSGDEHICTDLLFSFQHNIQLMENGDLLFFDNGNLSQGLLGDENPTTRIRRVKVIDNSYCETVWQYDLPPNLFGVGMGSVQELENGNYSIYTYGNGLGTPECSIIEVTPEKEIIWKATGEPNSAWYRSYKIPSMHPDAFSVIADGYSSIGESSSGSIQLIPGEPIKLSIENKSGYKQVYQYQFNDLMDGGTPPFLYDSGQIDIDPYSSFMLYITPENSDVLSTYVTFSIWPVGHEYAVKELLYNVLFDEPSVVGDVNSDGDINILDVVSLVNIVLDSGNNLNADLNQDGISNILDIVLLVGIILA